jgi:hypothetical protein
VLFVSPLHPEPRPGNILRRNRLEVRQRQPDRFGGSFIFSEIPPHVFVGTDRFSIPTAPRNSVALVA